MVELIELPPNDLAEILSKLPIKTIHALRCVCKTLLDLTSNSNPYFTHLHSPNATQHLIIQFGDSKHLKNYVQIIDAKIDTKPRTTAKKLRVRPMFKIPNVQIKENNYDFDPYSPHSTDVRELNKFALVNACNGLIYFAVKSLEQCSFVCNPITKQSVMVPEVVDRFRGYASSLWLGFSPISRKYKVLRIHIYDMGARIHDVGSSNSWRDITSTPLGYISWDNSCTFLNGTGYWLCQGDGTTYYKPGDFIVSFDFEREIFDKIKAIPGFNDSYRLRFMGLGVIEDCLCLIDNIVNLDIWMMDKCGEWSKKFSYDHHAFGKQIDNYIYMTNNDINMTKLRPLQVLSSGEIMMVSDDRRLVCYDTKKNSCRLIGLHMMKPKFNVVTFVPSFLSLEDILSNG